MQTNTSRQSTNVQRMLYKCATSWQQEGLPLKPNRSEKDLRDLYAHMAILMRLNTAYLDGHKGVPTHDIRSDYDIPVTRQLVFLFRYGLIKMGATHDYSWISITSSGRDLAKRIAQREHQAVH